MTLERFRTLAESYGADLQRWPEQLRSQAGQLLDSSAEAREIIATARELDEAIGAAGAARSDSIWSGDRPEAALARLRNGVAARIRPAAAAVSAASSRNVPRRVGWIGLATAASVAIVAGLALGIRYSPTTQQQDLLALLQPAPVQLLND
ncbi:MAG: hypothetical protein ACREVO_17495 [Steroidobacteraceae bacterium]